MDDPCFYGFPTYGEAGPKAAQDCGGRPVDPDRRTFERDETAFRSVDVVPGRPPARGPRPADLHEDLPLHAHPGSRLRGRPAARGARASASRSGAAHGFKFASVIGRILAELSVDGSTPSAAGLARFRIDRPILLEADPPTSWMV